MDFSGSCKGWQVIYNHPIGSIYHLYTTYILPSRGIYSPYHPLQEPEKSIELVICSICAMVKRRVSLGMGNLPPLIGNPYNGYINPYYWVDEFIPFIWK